MMKANYSREAWSSHGPCAALAPFDSRRQPDAGMAREEIGRVSPPPLIAFQSRYGISRGGKRWDIIPGQLR